MASTTPSDTALALLQGSYDLHIHAAPDIMARKGNDLDFARRAAAAGMAGIVLKSHYVCTADRATLVNQVVGGTRAYGALSLNHAVGGLNPVAVDIAGRLGARLVWFPTVDSKNEIDFQEQNPGAPKAFWYAIQQELKQQGMSRPPFSILNEGGKLRPEVYQVLEVIAAYHMILATGHIGVAEIVELVKGAREAGVTRIIATHPDFPSCAMPLDVQIELAQRGVFIERSYTNCQTGKFPWDTTFEYIRAVGPEHNLLGTDLGQPHALWPDEGLADFIQRLLDVGFSAGEIRTMVSENPGRLINP